MSGQGCSWPVPWLQLASPCAYGAARSGRRTGVADAERWYDPGEVRPRDLVTLPRCTCQSGGMVHLAHRWGACSARLPTGGSGALGHTSAPAPVAVSPGSGADGSRIGAADRAAAPQASLTRPRSDRQSHRGAGRLPLTASLRGVSAPRPVRRRDRREQVALAPGKQRSVGHTLRHHRRRREPGPPRISRQISAPRTRRRSWWRLRPRWTAASVSGSQRSAAAEGSGHGQD